LIVVNNLNAQITGSSHKNNDEEPVILLYKSIAISGKVMKIHQMVLESFHPPQGHFVLRKGEKR